MIHSTAGSIISTGPAAPWPNCRAVRSGRFSPWSFAHHGIAWWFLLSMAGAVAELSGSARPLGPGMALIAEFLPVDAGSFAATIADLCLSADSGALLVGQWALGLFAALVDHVAGDGGGHDAADGGADDPHLCRDRRHRGRARRTRGASAGSDSGLPDGVGIWQHWLRSRRFS
jgi:hypothetical protein